MFFTMHESQLDQIRKLGTALEREWRYRRVLWMSFDEAPVPMAVVNGEDYKIVNDSFCSMLGYAKPEIEGHPWRAFVFPEDLSETEIAAKSMDSGPLVKFSNRLISKSGAHVRVQWWTTQTTDRVAWCLAIPVEREDDRTQRV